MPRPVTYDLSHLNPPEPPDTPSMTSASPPHELPAPEEDLRFEDSSGEGESEGSEIEVWVRLARADLSARRLRRLLDHYGSPEAALGASWKELVDLGLNPAVAERFVASASEPLKSELSRIETLGIRALPYHHSDYPAPLAQIYDPPVAMFVRGELQKTDEFSVAIVGSRRATPYGRGVAERLAKELAEVGFTVVSGLARGVDTAAHQGTLAAGGRTLGVLGCGVDVAYPASNRGLIERVVKQGAVISEFAPGTPPDAWRFPARNRIISGLSKGLIVIESPENSGSMISVTYALEQGREVFAVPGSVETGLNSGCHRLLKEGAGLVETARDVLEAFGMADLKPKAVEPAPELSPVEQQLLEIVGFEGKGPDELIEESGLPAAQVNASLMMLEIHGQVRKLPGGTYVRTALL